VAYDRLRENRAKGAPRDKPFAEQMSDAVNQTLSRTVLTAATVVLSAAVLLFLGGKTLEDFAFVILLGKPHGHILHGVRGRGPRRRLDGLRRGPASPRRAPARSGEREPPGIARHRRSDSPMDDVLAKVLVVLGSCVMTVLVLAWYVSDPDDG
jgi:hypothetical protein